MEIEVDVSSFERMVANYRRVEPLMRRELRASMNRSVLAVERTAKQLVPVDTGNLRRTITHEVTVRGTDVVGKVGTNAPYAKPVEYGTGLLSEAPDGGGGRHFPPPAALDAWAIRHGFHTGSRASASLDAEASPGTYGFIVAQIIWRRGGIRPKPYLRPAQKDNLAGINKEFGLVLNRMLDKLAVTA
jgi:hypothetical protein